MVAAMSTPQPLQPSESKRLAPLVVAGYILAVVMPPAGLAIGVILLTRPPKTAFKQGLWIIALSVLVGFVFFVALILSSHSAGAATEGGE